MPMDINTTEQTGHEPHIEACTTGKQAYSAKKKACPIDK